MKNTRLDDKELVELYQKGDENAFEELVKRHKNSLYSMILLVTKEPYVAEDLLQETFVKVIRTIRSGKYKEKERFHYWIQRVGYNLAIDYFRKQKRTPIIVNNEGLDALENMKFSGSSVETIQMQKDERQELHAMMRELPEIQRKVLVMRNYLKMSFQDIAEEMGTSVNTALGRMRYALINLRKKIKQVQGEQKEYVKYYTKRK